ncbi:hypothetical protein GRI62_13815 [Erythrobacter arachoides]|uniref:Uncharacterized protein n=1 Tax=Aurantiacibacter arachoides TaxID=1850444 RepID=A0A845A699_9SPHN|nr:hypothetical protein [Aurantiacibacter arachoides]
MQHASHIGFDHRHTGARGTPRPLAQTYAGAAIRPALTMRVAPSSQAPRFTPGPTKDCNA